MLSFFRGGGVAQVIVGGVSFAIILVFALEFRAGRGSPTAKFKKECVVEFKSQCLDAKDYFAEYGLVAPRGIEQRAAKSISLRKRVLDGLVERELLVADATRLGIRVSSDAIDEELMRGRAHVSLPAEAAAQLSYQLGLCRPSELGHGCEPGGELLVRQFRVKRTPNEAFDYKLYEREVRVVTNRGPKEFKDMQEREMTAARMRSLVRSRVRVPEREAFMLYERGRSKAVVRSAVLKRDWFAKYAIDLSPASVDQWALANASQVDAAWEQAKASFTPDCPLVSEIVLELPPGATDEDKAPLHAQLEEARARITKGESFESVARDVSSGATAIVGGQLGCLSPSYGIGADELIKAAAGLKPSELSPVLETPRGFHLLKLKGKLSADQVEAVGRHMLAERLYVRFAAEEKVNAFAAELMRRAQAGSKLEEALNTLSREYVLTGALPEKAAVAARQLALAAADRPKLDISAPFTVSGNPLPDVDPKEPLAARAFELKNPDDVYSKPIPTSDGAVVLQLKEKMPAKRSEFEQDKESILRSLSDDKANEALVRYVADLRRQAGDKLKFDARFGEDQKSDRNNDE